MMPDTTIIEKLAKLPPLGKGIHTKPRKGEDPDGSCVMEAVAYIAGEPWSDHPACVCPVITAFLVSWNDALPSDEERDGLLRPLIPRVIGTRGSKALERRRSLMAADWLIRVHTPAWLRLAHLDAQATGLEGLPEITEMAQYPSLLGPLEAVRKDANAARDAATAAARDAATAAATAAAGVAARDAAWASARAAAGVAAWDAARAAARDAAWDAARDAARAAARDAAWDAARDAAGVVAWASAGVVAGDALKPAVLALQMSALDLVSRMIDATEPT